MAMIADRVRMKSTGKTGTITPLGGKRSPQLFLVAYDRESLDAPSGRGAEIGIQCSEDAFEVIEPASGTDIWVGEFDHGADVDPANWEGCEVLAHNTRSQYYVAVLFRASQEAAHTVALGPNVRVKPAPHAHYIDDQGPTIYVKYGQIRSEPP
jgi:hypothetical protein